MFQSVVGIQLSAEKNLACKASPVLYEGMYQCYLTCTLHYQAMQVTVWDHKNQKVLIENQAGFVQYIPLFKSNEKNLVFHQCTYTSIITYIEFSICAKFVFFRLVLVFRGGLTQEQ